MDDRNRAMIVVFLLCATAETAAEGRSLDVCASCHFDATCNDLPYGSGKMCNCKYGFIGNGRTFCVDKDECQLRGICGPYSTCHNTRGSYYCTCLAGYSPSNNKDTFIPNDGTYCQDVDECRITGQCGEGGQCRNLNGSFSCSCQLGYEIHDGVEPFNPHRDKASCKLVDCGQPASGEDTVLLSVTGTSYGSMAVFDCDEGFVWRSGDRSSVCGADGRWRRLSMVCEDVDCGSPPAVPHSRMQWDKSSRMSTEVLYQCISGYHNIGNGNISVCTAAGQWERPAVLCQETSCGRPPVVQSTEQVWDSSSAPGSSVLYVCKEGFYNKGGDNESICNEHGQWTPPTLSCQEVDCGVPALVPHSVMLWDEVSTVGSQVVYQCNSGYVHVGEGGVLVCTASGEWDGASPLCQEVDCGVPALVPDSVMLWDEVSTVGSQVVYQCNSGYVHVGEGGVLVCTASGEWDGASLLCQEVDCGVPALVPDSVMLWDEVSTVGSQVVYQCNSGYVHVGDGGVLVCTASGEWDGASPLCQEVDCGVPALVPHSVMLWDEVSTVGSQVVYQCNSGYVHVGEGGVLVCTASGEWDGASPLCQEVDCGVPALVPDSVMLWDEVSTVGSQVVYQCNSGYVHVGEGGVLVCTASGEWDGASLLCQEVDCGVPALVPHSVMLWDEVSTVGSQVVYQCNSGYVHVGEGGVLVCTASGEWDGASPLCQEVDCGVPALVPHSVMLWDEVSTVGSQVVYQCNSGYVHVGEGGVLVCTASGEWDGASLLCQEVDCGVPALVPHSVMLWDEVSTVGSQVVYQCNSGYVHVGDGGVLVCTASGEWDGASPLCQEISCEEPVFKAHANMLWDGTSHMGSVVLYQCEDGYHTRSRRNSSVCAESGLWEDVDLWCEEISCGPPLTLPHTNLLWDGSGAPGSVLLYECVDGFYQEAGNNMSTCLLSGQWGEVSVQCKAKCGPAPFLPKSEVVWHNMSVVIHRCVSGHHSWRGGNVSVCGSSGEWQTATLRCIEIKPPVSHLCVLKEKCLRWRAEKYEEDTEDYKVTYVGSRDFQRSFHDRRKQFVSSKADQLELCLNLLPVTNYSISITAVSSRFTASITTSTSLPVPPAPAVYYREFETPVPTLRLRRSANTLDPISLYQVFVLPVEGIVMFDCSSPASSNPKIKSSAEYITAQFDVRHVGTEMNFTVGDGLDYGGFFNAPLENGRNYYIMLRAVSQWKSALKSSCVLWAEVRGTSYVLRVSSLSAAALIGLVAFFMMCGYSSSWFFKRTCHS
ncbi:LOW QUALITY PROTEIN: sushi, von Willebrand factor type A, EGF and pentraxin domain-containing protein 1-like [Cottoperca gobio]|uniref:LOW QUALITY PROTEIN: sushi, von Willebrand factor type A, EGF and pentraxin domain-containing protein 1-like n=2 Tax=Cottoperca gobio TaxID=56716 RepID=A0A6J2QGX4_COTGO|nr:LOW QUALITY PROTEIN: sushi, von Willebrand factor type A, EGF and pentraxin domain-containing protein 1-like [Cottoperca gobio]